MKSVQSHVQRINRVIEHIESHLSGDLSLSMLAKIAYLSPFHFHRIFSTITGETVHEFVQRKRLEKTASALLLDRDRPIKELSHKYGFDNSTSFSRAFKKHYGLSASELRKKAKGPITKLVKHKSKIGKEHLRIEHYIHNIETARTWMRAHARVERRELPAKKLAYMRNKGTFEQMYQTFLELKNWAQSAGLLERKDLKWLMVIHDNPAITEELKMMQSAAIPLKREMMTSEEIGMMVIPKGPFLVGHFELTDRQFKRAWDGMVIWMLDHGFKARDGHHFELFHSNSLFEKGERHLVDICIPIK